MAYLASRDYATGTSPYNMPPLSPPGKGGGGRRGLYRHDVQEDGVLQGETWRNLRLHKFTSEIYLEKGKNMSISIKGARSYQINLRHRLVPQRIN